MKTEPSADTSSDQSERVATEENAAASRAKSEHGELHDARKIYVYPSSGIAERRGVVPKWLWVVAISLVIWGLYYLAVYWNPPAT